MEPLEPLLAFFASGNDLNAPHDTIFSPAHEPNINISPTSYDFGNINIGDTSTAQLFTITNTGNADLTFGFDNISLTGPDASEFGLQDDICSTQIIVPSGTCTIKLHFHQHQKVLRVQIYLFHPMTLIHLY